MKFYLRRENKINNSKPEFGNIDHISFVKKYQAIIDGIEPVKDIREPKLFDYDNNDFISERFSFTIGFNCAICNCNIYVDVDEDTFPREIEMKCDKCYAHYIKAKNDTRIYFKTENEE